MVDDMHQRKRRMYDLSDGFCALPGGYGTLDEVFEAVTWSQLGLHAAGRVKPVVLLDVDGYWQSLVAFLDGTVSAGFRDGPQSPADRVGRRCVGHGGCH